MIRRIGRPCRSSGVAAARAAGQASGVAHIGAHALGTAAYAAKVASLAAADQETERRDQVRWQIDRVTPAVRPALSRMPLLGENSSGPMCTGLLTSGVFAVTIREIQSELSCDAEV
ncbi:putative immunity protein [Microbacterium sp. LWH11-1.2]|uniref:putative immunity protein n=1 Tax=Microbacterium sp. LWH11-1.2 TaxID=3135258 RepID=UPI003139D2E3